MVIKKEKIGNKSMLICQECQKAYSNGKYCRFCYTTYKDNTNAHEDGKDWVQCDTVNCLSWVFILLKYYFKAFYVIIKIYFK